MNTRNGDAGLQLATRTVFRLVLAVLLLRLLTLGIYPLMDSTEARYAEIGRKMLELGDWVTPWFDHGIPFWGKPPLMFWLTAGSFGIFGSNEFAARLPHFLAGLLCIFLLWQWAALYNRQVATWSMALLAGTLLFIGTAGGVMTDMSLEVGIVLAMRGFWLALYGPESLRRREGWLFFVGLAIGLLAKGPLVLVITGLPIGLWSLWGNERLARIWQALPWARGIALMLLLAAPWYLLAEQKTPGFLSYFLAGEHWHRFVTPGWTGDRYGSAHAVPHGMIWIYALISCLPWTLLLPVLAWRQRGTALRVREALRVHEGNEDNRRLSRYLLLWALMPCVFFTFAGNLLPTYVLPGIPALALLLAHWLDRLPERAHVERWLAAGLMVTALLVPAVPLAVNHSGIGELRSAKALVNDFHASRKNNEPLLVLGSKNKFSLAFYTRGEARFLAGGSSLPGNVRACYLAVTPRLQATLPPAVAARMQPQGMHGQYRLFHIP